MPKVRFKSSPLYIISQMLKVVKKNLPRLANKLLTVIQNKELKWTKIKSTEIALSIAIYNVDFNMEHILYLSISSSTHK